ncbi:hypothetical protein, partial [Aliivibrio fischeri]
CYAGVSCFGGIMKLEQTIEEFLDPKLLRSRLISGALYVLFYESLKDEIIDKLKFYYCHGGQETDYYRESVKKRNKSVLYASLDWFKSRDAIDDEDMAAFEEIKKCRNALSHDLHNLIGSRGLPVDFDNNYNALLALRYKLDHWWIINVEIATDPEYWDKDINPEEVIPGSSLMQKMMVEIALGDEDVSEQYLKDYLQAKGHS